MPVGLNASLTRADVDSRAGTIAQRLNTVMEDVADFKYFLDGADAAQMAALGYTPEEASILVSAYGDLDQLRTVYQGAAEVTPAKDFRTFARRLWGTGFPPSGTPSP